MTKDQIKQVLNLEASSRIDEITDPKLVNNGIRVFVKREDLVHPLLSGNKWRKLKYNVEKARQMNKSTLLTFGGAYSNHIAATAFAGQFYGMKTIGIIRGERVPNLSVTLERAEQQGMQLRFISRSEYRNKENEGFLAQLQEEYDDALIIPEGGANEEGVQGCEEILDGLHEKYDFVVAACGTGSTLAGILRSSSPDTQLLGIACHKAIEYLRDQVNAFAPSKTNFEIISAYHFGGYAKKSKELEEFIRDFKSISDIPIEFVYSAKMFYAVFDMIKKGRFPANSRILCIHTGGLQYMLPLVV